MSELALKLINETEERRLFFNTTKNVVIRKHLEEFGEHTVSKKQINILISLAVI